MVLYPALETLLQLTPHAFGLWAGASVHEIAQVVAAAFQNGADSGNFGTIAKLSRVMLLAPMVLLLGSFCAGRAERGEPSKRKSAPMPWFVLGFVAMMMLNSLGVIPQPEKARLPLDDDPGMCGKAGERIMLGGLRQSLFAGRR